NGLVYFTEGLTGRIGFFNPATITSSSDINDNNVVPTFGSSALPIPNGITYDPADGKLWFVEQGENRIGMFDPATQSFNTTAYNLPNASKNPLPPSIALGSDGTLWFNEYSTGQVDMFNPASRTFAANGPYSLPASANNPKAPIVGIAAG